MKKKLSVLLILMVLIFSMTIVTNAATTKMNKSSATIQIGDTVQLKVLVDGVATSAVWKSPNTSVATVNSSGLVTGKAAGSSVIKATVNGHYS